jgi:putative DNA primase/helicase
MEPWAEDIIAGLGSYTESSPSEEGVHVIVTGKLPDGRRQFDFGDRPHHGIGLYEAGGPRYITMTGKVISDGAVIAERTEELGRIHARYFAPKLKKPKSEAGASVSDDELIAKALKATDGKFARLWQGAWEGLYASPSEADLGLCCKLAFWTNRNPGRIDALFRRSGLMRDKWLREDYRDRTIAKAVELTTEAWKGKPAPPVAPHVATVDLSRCQPSLELLNAQPILDGRIQFHSVCRADPCSSRSPLRSRKWFGIRLPI